jgi:hypothetical protein
MSVPHMYVTSTLSLSIFGNVFAVCEENYSNNKTLKSRQEKCPPPPFCMCTYLLSDGAIVQEIAHAQVEIPTPGAMQDLGPGDTALPPPPPHGTETDRKKGRPRTPDFATF